jgi:hypothetical protein
MVGEWVDLRRAILFALGVTGCAARDIGPGESGDEQGDGSSDAESDADDGSESSITATTVNSATATVTTTATTATATDPSDEGDDEGSDDGRPECEADPDDWEQVGFCIERGSGDACSPCAGDEACESSAEGASQVACSPVFQEVLCGPEVVDGQCCYVARVIDEGCAGRPFVVAGERRSATACTRADWASELAPTMSLSDDARTCIGEAWRAAALAEHASIAAFARFVLDLLSLGAPADLVLAAQRALADEVVHARLAFGLASAYLGAPIGPGAIATDGSERARGLADIVRDAIVEGCIGETLAAAEAEHARDACTDPAVRRVLATIARDEQRHAALAWRFVAWALGRDPSLRPVVADAFASVRGPQPRLASTDELRDAALRAHGIVPRAEASALAAEVLHAVIEPCARALLREDAAKQAARASVCA